LPHVFSFFLSLACIGQGSSSTAESNDKGTKLHDQLSQILFEQSRDWNRGDIPKFMSAYWKDDRLTFSSGGTTTRGWQATLDRYLKRYPDQTIMGQLTFSELETEHLSDDVALMLGRWHLKREEPIGGNFSLVWKRIDGTWLIVHDHSSSDAKP
jgi:ketosteroid isomerase-like protein